MEGMHKNLTAAILRKYSVRSSQEVTRGTNFALRARGSVSPYVVLELPMKFLSPRSLLALNLAILAASCSSKKGDSSLSITPRNHMTLQQKGDFRYEQLEDGKDEVRLQIQNADISIDMNAMGHISWNGMVDIQVGSAKPGDIATLSDLSFEGTYQGSYKDVSFATYKKMSYGDVYQVKNHLKITRKSTLGNGDLAVIVEHLYTGLTGDAVLTESRNGLVDLKSLTMHTTRLLPLSINDEQERGYSWYQDMKGRWINGLMRMVEGEVTLFKVED